MTAGKSFCLAFLCCLFVGDVSSGQETRLLRYPDLHGDRLVFTYAGDLWTVADDGGQARRLTAHPGLELFAKFSPDGKWLAFTGQYDGDEQVYVMPSEGGEPKQLTYYPARGPLPDRWGFDNQVYGWHPDGKRILFRSLRHGWSLADNQLFTVGVDGGLPVALPMPRSGAGDFADDGRRVAYSPLFRDFRAWKRYQGGWAQDLYIYDPEGKHQRVTEHPRSDRDPMWIGDRLYFASDRDGVLNLFYYELEEQKTHQVTRETRYDVRWPSRSNDGRIVYELNGRLHVLETKSGESRAVPIWAPNDGLATRPHSVSTAKYIESFGLSPNGERALFVARGDVYTAPLEKGPTRNLTRSSSAHDKWASWSPDGAQVAYLSDADGEEELYLIDERGSGEPLQLTEGGAAMRYEPRWSPDGRFLAFSDNTGHLFVVNVRSREQTVVAKERFGQIRDYAWSPHGGHLAFSMRSENNFPALHIWSVANKRLRKVTGDDFRETNPSWDPSGKYLFYLSVRQFAPQMDRSEWNYASNRHTGIFALALRKDVKHPFPPESDEVERSADELPAAAETPRPKAKRIRRRAKSKRPKGKRKKQQDPQADDAERSKPAIKIDFEGLAGRAVRVPVADDNYSRLTAIDGHLLYVRGGAFYYGRGAGVKSELRIFSLKSRKTEKLADTSAYALSASGEKLLVREGDAFKLLAATMNGASGAKPVSTGGLRARVEPRREWEQIFNEVWRRYRDFFYVSNMHGYDWRALRDKYRPLLKDVGHRTDLNYVIGEMIAELNVGHAYNAGGDFVQPERPTSALPGARFELDAAAGRYRLSKVFAGQNEESVYRGPLTEVGVRASQGDYVLAIDGEPLEAGDNPYRMLRGKSHRQVSLTLNDKPSKEGSWTTTYLGTPHERDLVYLDWILDCRHRVNKATKGRVGYVHLPNMGAEGIREFIKWYYSQLRKEALIIDVRKNGGGNVSQMVIDRLRRSLLATGFSRNSQRTSTYPRTVFHGHLVCILDENSGSDGDIFPAMFREAGLGPLIGKRSWGGVIGITNRGGLIDGGSVSVPEFGFASKEGKWVIEGYGVDPDIEVANDPLLVIQGRDPQLERAIKEALKRIKDDPKRLPQRPAPPVKREQ